MQGCRKRRRSHVLSEIGGQREEVPRAQQDAVQPFRRAHLVPHQLRRALPLCSRVGRGSEHLRKDTAITEAVEGGEELARADRERVELVDHAHQVQLIQ